jgi:hypothetical protein
MNLFILEKNNEPEFVQYLKKRENMILYTQTKLKRQINGLKTKLGPVQ